MVIGRTDDPSRGPSLVWLFTLTHRRAVDVVRREQACLARDSQHHREMTALGQDSLEELILRRVEDEETLAGLCALSAAQSKAITLAYLGGQTYTEVAVSLPAVKSRLRDGLRNLRQSLDPAGGE